ncbi:type I restriction-modification system subunit M [Carboxylicivirga sp. N1Y90]|uniref:type I restriction-modification system subunit M n=1 Tax=Carboxylicivirga fragile TaxID=3417571 RepID=UPI003D32A2C1|nr:SAM-dependent DNA methyltransferase [Marinilabiliaceae bacterium N1Y90]
MITGELKSQIDQIWNVFWTGGVTNTITIVEQLTYLIFIKDLDEIETRNERKAKRGFKYTPVFDDTQQDFRWKNLKEMDVNARFTIFSSTEDGKGIFPFIRTLGKDKSLFATHMRGANFGISKPMVLDAVMEKLESINMDDQDTKGDIYEYLLSKLEGGGTAGQFRTPRHIIKMMVHLVKPTLEDTICDPSCGTAGFLVAAKEYIDHHNDVVELDKHSAHINNAMFNGMEFDATMLRIASMNLYLHGVQEPNIADVDAVSKDNTVADAYSLVLANPPFKGTIDKESVAPGLKNVTNTTKTELLFLALMLRMLKMGGRCAVIVPDGVLFGSGKAHKSLRQEIVANNKLEAVISMPSGVFKPYAGVSTAVLIFTKTGSGGTDKVWFYDMLADGKSLDDKRNILVDEDLFSSFIGDAELSEEVITKNHDNFNIPDIIARYHSLSPLGAMSEGQRGVEDDRKRTEQSFLVPFSEIEENDYDLSINRYKEIVYEEVEFDKPEVILERIEKLDEERNSLSVTLKSLLND